MKSGEGLVVARDSSCEVDRLPPLVGGLYGRLASSRVQTIADSQIKEALHVLYLRNTHARLARRSGRDSLLSIGFRCSILTTRVLDFIL